MGNFLPLYSVMVSALYSNLTPLVNCISVSDLDDATVHNKVYYFNAGAAHNPGYNYGMVAVWKEANNINQMAWPRGGIGNTSESMSRRSKNGNTGEWGEWVKQPSRAEFDTLNNSIGTLSGIKTVVVNDTTNESGIITLNVGTFTGRPYVISNISSNLQTPYRITCDGWAPSTGTVNLRVRKSSDNTAITNTTIQDTVLIIFSR